MLNLMVVFQVIFAALVDYLMMGLVFARWAKGVVGVQAAVVLHCNTPSYHQRALDQCLISA